MKEFQEANASRVTDRLVVGGDLDLDDDQRAIGQLVELVEGAGVTHIIDCRIEADDWWLMSERDDVGYLHHGIDDLGQRVPDRWFEQGVRFALEALAEPGTVLLTHCHMGINRGPSLGFAVLLALGWDAVEAMGAIRAARPEAGVAYAEDALGWYHRSRDVGAEQRQQDRGRLARWREENPLDVVRIIADRRRDGG